MEHKSNKATVAIIVAVVAVLLVAGIGYAISQSNTTPEPNDSQQKSITRETAEDEAMTGSESAPASSSDTSTTTIVFTDDGFNPASYTVKKGATVTVENASSMDVQFSSDDHPAHTEQTELNLRTLEPGDSATFTVTKVGTWGFHDHINEQYTGTLVVTE